jgi:hypothetical protein
MWFSGGTAGLLILSLLIQNDAGSVFCWGRRGGWGLGRCVVCEECEVCQGRSRRESVLKILILLGSVCPIITLDAAPSAEFIDATHIWRCSVSVDPRWWKSWLSRCRWHGRRSSGLVLISSFILDVSSVCSEAVSPSILWWTSALRYIRATEGVRAYPWIWSKYVSVRECVRPPANNVGGVMYYLAS